MWSAQLETETSAGGAGCTCAWLCFAPESAKLPMRWTGAQTIFLTRMEVEYNGRFFPNTGVMEPVPTHHEDLDFIGR